MDTIQATVKFGPKLSWPAYWQNLLHADAQGEWSLAALARCVGTDEAGARRLLQRLMRSGLVVAVNPANLFKFRRYRLTSRQEHAPRIEPAGTIADETLSQTVWRAVKMAKTFSAEDIAIGIGQEIRHVEIRRYLLALAGASILAVTGERGRESFRLRRNVGAQAPVMVQATGLFDPNAGAFVGAIICDEAQP